MFKVNNGLSVQLVRENFYFVENHYNFRHQSGKNLRLIMLKLKHMADNLDRISDLKSGIPYRKK